MFALHPSPIEIRAHSLRVAVVCVVIIVIFFFLSVVFFFFFWLLSKEDIGNYRPIRRSESGRSGCILLMPSGTPHKAVTFTTQRLSFFLLSARCRNTHATQQFFLL